VCVCERERERERERECVCFDQRHLPFGHAVKHAFEARACMQACKRGVASACVYCATRRVSRMCTSTLRMFFFPPSSLTYFVYPESNAGELEGYGVYIYSGIGPHAHDRS